LRQILALVGPTAAGKTETAVLIAQQIDAEILSVDSMQVYRGMDIGTAKPTVEERQGVIHHMIDLVEPDQEFSVSEFQQLGREVIEAGEGPLVITGGSGLHFRALVDPMTFPPTDMALRRHLETLPLIELVGEIAEADPAAEDYVDLSNHRRVVRAVEIHRLTGETPSGRGESDEARALKDYEAQIPFKGIGVDPGGIERRVEARLTRMRRAGLLDEVKALSPRLGRTAASAVGYRELLDHLAGVVSEEDAFAAIARSTRQLAKKQRTWFQRDPRIEWIAWSDDAATRAKTAMEALS
jgi:tRNA dimethylallyltransferase